RKIRLGEPAVLLFHLHERRDDLAIHIVGRAVSARFAARRDDHRAKQAGVDVPHLVDMGVVHPHDRAAVHRSGTGPVWYCPYICMSPAWRHAVIQLVTGAGAVVVWHTLGALVVQDSVRMHAVRPIAVVAEHDADGIAHHSTNQWPEKTEVFPSRGPGFERAKA